MSRAEEDATLMQLLSGPGTKVPNEDDRSAARVNALVTILCGAMCGIAPIACPAVPLPEGVDSAPAMARAGTMPDSFRPWDAKAVMHSATGALFAAHHAR